MVARHSSQNKAVRPVSRHRFTRIGPIFISDFQRRIIKLLLYQFKQRRTTLAARKSRGKNHWNTTPSRAADSTPRVVDGLHYLRRRLVHFFAPPSRPRERELAGGPFSDSGCGDDTGRAGARASGAERGCGNGFDCGDVQHDGDDERKSRNSLWTGRLWREHRRQDFWFTALAGSIDLDRGRS